MWEWEELKDLRYTLKVEGTGFAQGSAVDSDKGRKEERHAPGFWLEKMYG